MNTTNLNQKSKENCDEMKYGIRKKLNNRILAIQVQENGKTLERLRAQRKSINDAQ